MRIEYAAGLIAGSIGALAAGAGVTLALACGPDHPADSAARLEDRYSAALALCTEAAKTIEQGVVCQAGVRAAFEPLWNAELAKEAAQ